MSIVSEIEHRLSRLGLPVAVSFWDGITISPLESPKIHLTLKSPRAISSLVRPTLGKIAKAYVEGQIDIEGDPRETIEIGQRLVSEHASTYQRRSAVLSWWRHTRPSDRRAIQHHYDVGNEFYGLWLDRNRVYSCGYFKSPDDSLDLAQEQKLEHICRKLQLKPGERFLDIGCGWGALIIWAARHYGVKAVGITLSDEQHALANQRIKELGLEESCEARLMDYRDVPSDQVFDKIASVGMFEHVGKKNLPVYFAKIHSLLKPGGMVMNHGITTNSLDDRALGSDIGKFVDEYVFPGGELVHVSRVIREMSIQGLEMWDSESLRPHYAKTLWHWVERLEANAVRARELVGERRYRVWRIYMAGSAHAFERGWISIFQILGGKPLDNGSLPYPLTREHVYAVDQR
ncbi:MAG: class I SAM-dependent methyltransferase [Betaproteobacteria bacterium]|jgi:cyclopropane-fatty-acyl-phospholipid synthase|nr:MAG: class I SAM-dependent methyltransferase [Betaproteobacteria bacterium]